MLALVKYLVKAKIQSVKFSSGLPLYTGINFLAELISSLSTWVGIICLILS
jgi:hypothetical protein